MKRERDQIGNWSCRKNSYLLAGDSDIYNCYFSSVRAKLIILFVTEAHWWLVCLKERRLRIENTLMSSSLKKLLSATYTITGTPLERWIESLNLNKKKNKLLVKYTIVQAYSRILKLSYITTYLKMSTIYFGGRGICITTAFLFVCTV